jgi:hypothetical protein
VSWNRSSSFFIFAMVVSAVRGLHGAIPRIRLSS